MTISIDLETFSDVDIKTGGVYRYVESPYFEILLFGYSVDGGEVTVLDLKCGDEIPEDILNAIVSDDVIKWAFNASFAEDGQKNAQLDRVEVNENGLTKEELAELEALKEELLEGEDIEKVTGISQEKDENTLINNVTKLIPWFIILLLFGIIGVVVTLYIMRKNNNRGDI